MVPNLAMIKKPAQFVMLAETANGNSPDMGGNCFGYLADNNAYGACINTPGYTQVLPQITNGTLPLMARHSNGMNIATMDGSVKWRRLEAVIPRPPQNPGCSSVEELRDFNSANLRWLIWNRCID